MMMTEVGAAYLDDAEAEALRDYCSRAASCGPTISGASTRGRRGRSRCARRYRRRSSRSEDLPPDHPLFRAQFDIERRAADRVDRALVQQRRRHVGARRRTAPCRTRAAIFDTHGRMMVLMTHNTDIGDSWEEEASNPQYFYEFSIKGYAFGINAIVYAMTH